MHTRSQLARGAVAALFCLLLAAAADARSEPSSQTTGSAKRLVQLTLSEGPVITSYPPASVPQTVGSTAVYSTDLFQGDLKVGTVVWTGTYIEVTGSTTRVNYLVNFEFTAGPYKGTLVASGIGGGVRVSPATTVVVHGGTGDFDGASGTITWGDPPARASNGGAYYTFKLFLTPKAASTNGQSPTSLLSAPGSKPANVQNEAAASG